MKVQTALMAFSVTTLLLISGLIALTGIQLGLGRTSSVGNYYIGIPTQGQALREVLPYTIPDVDPADPACYVNAINGCARLNAGENYISCVDRVAIDCGAPEANMMTCYLQPGFELKYRTSKECAYNVAVECNMRCPVALLKECSRLSKGRCNLIGGKFQSVYEQTKYTNYPTVQPSVLS